MWAELIFLNLLWAMWSLNLFDVFITQCGIRHHGMSETNFFAVRFIEIVGWPWFALIKVGAVSWLHVFLLSIFVWVPSFRSHAWFAAIVAFTVLLVACLWNSYLVLSERNEKCQPPSKA